MSSSADGLYNEYVIVNGSIASVLCAQVSEEQIADAVDASCLITTSQNYIKTKVGAEETKLSVLLKGGS